MSELSIRLRAEIALLRKRAQYGRIITVCKQQITIARDVNDREAEAVALLGFAIGQRYKGKIHEANLLSEGALDFALSVGRDELVSEALITSADNKLYGLLQPAEAEVDFREALSIASDVQYRRGMVQSLYGLAMSLNDQQKFYDARTTANHALGVAVDLEDAYWQGMSLNAIGVSFFGLNQVDKAQSHFETALNIAQDNSLAGVEALTILNLARLTRDNNAPDSLELYLLALNKIQDIGDVELEYFALQGAGLTHLALNEGNLAMEYFRDMLALSEDTMNDTYIAGAYLHFAITLYLTKQANEAQRFIHQALDLAQKYDNKIMQALILSWQARLYQQQKQSIPAFDALNRAVNLYNEVGMSQASRELFGDWVRFGFRALVQRITRLIQGSPPDEGIS